jgi:hypothetical protein
MDALFILGGGTSSAFDMLVLRDRRFPFKFGICLNTEMLQFLVIGGSESDEIVSFVAKVGLNSRRA